MVKILDTTLREGEQTNGVKFTKKQKITLAKLLDDFGVDKIEAGHPIISKKDFESVKAVAHLKLKAEILGHARARKEDIDAVFNTGCSRVGIFCGINELSRKYKLLGKTKEEVFQMIEEAIKYAKTKKLKVRYTVEDATRTEINDLIKIAQIAQNSGADIFSVADTVGYATPSLMEEIIIQLKQQTNIPLEVHCHNDLGLALANALEAYNQGVDTIDVTINGLGERAGLVSLAELCTILNKKHDEHYALHKLSKLSQITTKYSKIKLDKLRPILGENAFTHTADLHKKAVTQHPQTYETLNPQQLGRKRKN